MVLLGQVRMTAEPYSLTHLLCGCQDFVTNRGKASAQPSSAVNALIDRRLRAELKGCVQAVQSIRVEPRKSARSASVFPCVKAVPESACAPVCSREHYVQVLNDCLASLGLVRGLPDAKFHKMLSTLRNQAEEAGRGFLSVEVLTMQTLT